MSDWIPRSDSKWSSERDRARQRHDAPDTIEPDAPTAPPDSGERPPSSSPRSTRRKYTTSRTSPSSSFSPRSPERRATSPASSRSRSQPGPPAPPSGGGAPPGGNLPDLPGSSGSGGGSRNNRVLILGALLFLGMAAIAILPQLLGDDGDTEPTPTPEMIQTPTPPSN